MQMQSGQSGGQESVPSSGSHVEEQVSTFPPSSSTAARQRPESWPTTMRTRAGAKARAASRACTLAVYGCASRRSRHPMLPGSRFAYLPERSSMLTSRPDALAGDSSRAGSEPSVCCFAEADRRARPRSARRLSQTDEKAESRHARVGWGLQSSSPRGRVPVGQGNSRSVRPSGDASRVMPPASVVQLPIITTQVPSGADIAALLRGPPATLATVGHVLDAHALAAAESFSELLSLRQLVGVEQHAYQTETVRRVLRMHRGRALLADEVGLGKTIEALM